MYNIKIDVIFSLKIVAKLSYSKTFVYLMALILKKLGLRYKADVYALRHNEVNEVRIFDVSIKAKKNFTSTLKPI